MRGKEQLGVKVVHAGDIGTVPKLNVTSTGDTLCDKGHPLVLSVPEYPSALFQVSVTPKTQADSAKLSPTLTRLCEEGFNPYLAPGSQHQSNHFTGHGRPTYRCGNP